MENIVEINVDLLDKYDLVEKYNKSVVSRNLIDYINSKNHKKFEWDTK